MMTKKTWDEFQQCKLLWRVNRTLHLFGWAIVLSYDEDGKFLEAYPARVGFRGFNKDFETEGFETLTAYLAKEAPALLAEVQEDL